MTKYKAFFKGLTISKFFSYCKFVIGDLCLTAIFNSDLCVLVSIEG